MYNADQLLHICDKLMHLDDDVAVKSLLVECMKPYGVDYYVILAHSFHLDQIEPNIVATNFPETWVHRYIAEQYMDDDPVYLQGLISSKRFSWSEITLAPKNPAKVQQIMTEAAEYGLCDGLLVPLFRNNAKAGWISLCGMRLHLSERNLFELEMLATAGAIGLLNRSYEAKLISDCPQKLTKRQIEVLSLASEGKGTEQIAEMMGVTKRTVNFHFDKAAQSLGTINRAHTISKAFRLGLLSL